jgi:hypothetical protein
MFSKQYALKQRANNQRLLVQRVLFQKAINQRIINQRIINQRIINQRALSNNATIAQVDPVVTVDPVIIVEPLVKSDEPIVCACISNYSVDYNCLKEETEYTHITIPENVPVIVLKKKY